MTHADRESARMELNFILGIVEKWRKLPLTNAKS
jgi:hypothetical protein